MVWAVVVVIFFSLSKSKLPGYILSATVACGILVARIFDEAWTTRTENRRGLSARRDLFLVCVVCLAASLRRLFCHPHPVRWPGRWAFQWPILPGLGQHLPAVPMILLVWRSRCLGVLGGFRGGRRSGFCLLRLFPCC